MTRFTRAKGSKASNQRMPEDATSWQEMKQGMLKNNNKIDNIEDESRLIKSSNNVEIPFKIRSEKKIETPAKWSEFPVLDHSNDKHKKETKKKRKLKHSEETISEIDNTKSKKIKSQSNSTNCEEENTLNISVKKKSKKHKRDAVNGGKTCNHSLEMTHENASGNEGQEFQEQDASETSINKKSKKHKKNKDEPQNQSLEASENVQGFQDESTDFNKNKQKHSKKNKKEFNNKKHQQFSKSDAGSTNKKSFNNDKFNKEYKRRKPNSQMETILINGNLVDIAYYDGFPIKKEDAERLATLKKEMISRGLPRSEIAQALKLERRKAEKALAREKKKVCFNCRGSGHILSECPSLKSGSNAQLTETGICFKCGSTEHTHFECKVTRGDNFKFAQCFICKEQGHIARQCPDNSRGLYPKGGACRVCGDVTHLMKDCPKYQSEQDERKIVADTIDNQNIESLENEAVTVNKKSKKFQKVIKF